MSILDEIKSRSWEKKLKPTQTIVKTKKDMFGVNSIIPFPRAFYEFDEEKVKWVKCDPGKMSSEDDIPTTNGFSLLSWNVWFDDFKFVERSNSQLEIISKEEPDIICTQEATPKMITHFSSSKVIRKNYAIGDHVKEALNFAHEGDGLRYGTLFFVKRSLVRNKCIRNYKKIPMDSISIQARYLISFDFWLKRKVHESPELINISTVHLESTNYDGDGSNERRKKQLEFVVSEVQRERSQAICCGDFNFCPYSHPKENEIFSKDTEWKKYRDVWKTVHQKEEEEEEEMEGETEKGEEWRMGYTRNSEINTMVEMGGNEKLYRKRIDRVMLKSDKFRPSSIRIIGNKEIEEKVFPSDHFGLFCKFERIIRNTVL